MHGYIYLSKVILNSESGIYSYNIGNRYIYIAANLSMAS